MTPDRRGRADVPTPAVRPDAIRRHNAALVLGQVHVDGALTRAELTVRSGLSRSTIGTLVAELADLGLVEETVPTGGTRAGRPSYVVGPHRAGPYVLAVDVDVRHVMSAAVGLGGRLLARRVVTTNGRRPDPEFVAERIREAMPLLAAAAGREAAPVGVGVSVPGTVDRRDGSIGVAPNLGWREIDLSALLATVVPTATPVVLGNDADLAVLAEHRRGSGRGCQDLVFLMGRIGVGAGIIVNGSPVRGYDGHAGEIGHNVVDPSGPPCHCGKRGCLETLVGEQALLDRAEAALSGAGPAEVFAAARSGEPAAVRAVHGVAAALGQTVASLVNTLNPELVVLGGSFAEVLDLARPQLRAAVDHHVLDAAGATVTLCRPTLGEDAALLGAAEVAFADLLADPLGRRCPDQRVLAGG